MNGRYPWHAGPARLTLGILALSTLGGMLAGCSSSTPTAAVSGAGASCSGVSGAHHVRVVVEASPSKIVSSCVGFSTPTLSAVKALEKSKIELGTQNYGGSLGLAVCQADDVPAHYTQCFPTDAPYWAVFTSSDGAAWAAAQVGLSQITVDPGDSVGLRYDPASGTAAPPPAPSPA